MRTFVLGLVVAVTLSGCSSETQTEPSRVQTCDPTTTTERVDNGWRVTITERDCSTLVCTVDIEDEAEAVDWCRTHG